MRSAVYVLDTLNTEHCWCEAAVTNYLYCFNLFTAR